MTDSDRISTFHVSLFHDERGVSVIFGTLMLILITIVAASGIAVMVSTVQKDAMELESHLTAVENENLRIISIDPVGNSTHWNSVNITILNLNTADSYITAINVNNIYAKNYLANDKSGSPDYYKGYPVIYNFNKRVLIPAARSKEIYLNFTEIIIDTSEVIDVSGWINNSENYTFSLSHFPIVYGSENVSNSTVPHFIPGNNYTMNCAIGNITLISTTFGGNMTNASNYDITYKTRFETFTPPLSLRKEDSIALEVITSLINIFKQTFMPPVPLAEVQFETERIVDTNGSVSFRDYLILDASGSFDPDGFITGYRWAVWDNSSELIYNYNLTGVMARPTKLNLTDSTNIKIDLEVSDDTGMVSRLSQRGGNITIS